MSVGEFALGEEPLGGPEVGTDPADDVWVHRAGLLAADVRLNTVDIDESLGSRARARFVLVNPVSDPAIGEIVTIAWQVQTVFFGTVDRRRLTTSPDGHNARLWSCEAVGLWQSLERRIVSPSYADKTTGFIFRALHTTVLAAEGIGTGQIDSGLPLVLAEGDQMRLSEFLRDVAAASGGVTYIDPADQTLHFRAGTAPSALFVLDESKVLADGGAELEETREQYRNRQHVKATGTGGAVVTVTRSDNDQIAARQAIEGGTGIYEAFDEISHPASNDVVELERLGIAFAQQRLLAAGRPRQSLRATLREPFVRVGQLITVNLPEYGAAGTWQITRLRTRWLFGSDLRFDVMMVRTTPFDLAMDAWLRMAGASRAIIQAQSIGLFDTLVTFTANDTFVVPDKHGDGSPVELEATAFGAGGGGAGGSEKPFGGGPTKGGDGGNGGKATSFRTYTPGTILTIAVGAGGAGGTGGASIPELNGQDGGPSSVVEGPTVMAQGDGGGGGTGGDEVLVFATDGADGNGTGDHVFIGAGSLGGEGGFGILADGTPGSAGKVEIRY